MTAATDTQARYNTLLGELLGAELTEQNMAEVTNARLASAALYASASEKASQARIAQRTIGAEIDTLVAAYAAEHGIDTDAAIDKLNGF